MKKKNTEFMKNYEKNGKATAPTTKTHKNIER